MAHNEKLADRVREALAELPDVEEKKMFRGVTFMVNGKMCVSVGDDELMCRIGPDHFEEALAMDGVRGMIRHGRTLKDFVFVGPEHTKTKKDFDRWIKLSLDFNNKARATKKKSKTK